jgi:uncharacterized protein
MTIDLSPQQKTEIVAGTEAYVRETLQSDSSGHDWWHIHRVRNLALRLADREGADIFISELAALLHDIADWKFHHGDTEIGAQRAAQWLQSQDVPAEIISPVCAIVASISFKGAGVKPELLSLEGRVVQDADRLDAIGAVGIARTFAYGGHFNRTMHDPEIKPTEHQTFEQYKNSEGTTINHFFEKLLLLKERLNTPSAKQIAEHRHDYMQNFLTEFFAEWQGDR